MRTRFKRRSGRAAALWVLIVTAVIVCGLSVPPGVVFAKAPLGKQLPAAQQLSRIETKYELHRVMLPR